MKTKKHTHRKNQNTSSAIFTYNWIVFDGGCLARYLAHGTTIWRRDVAARPHRQNQNGKSIRNARDFLRRVITKATHFVRSLSNNESNSNNMNRTRCKTIDTLQFKWDKPIPENAKHQQFDDNSFACALRSNMCLQIRTPNNIAATPVISIAFAPFVRRRHQSKFKIHLSQRAKSTRSTETKTAVWVWSRSSARPSIDSINIDLNVASGDDRTDESHETIADCINK